MISSSYTIILTACINPNGMIYTYLQDTKEREKQYIEAIKFYLNNTKYKIVFCNNSGEDISSKISANKNRIEILSFRGNDYEKSLGKGYGEYLILQYAFQHSEFLKKSKYVIKITGRIIVPNISKVLKLTDMILAYPSNKVYVTQYMDEKETDSRCIVATKRFFEIFLSTGNYINDAKGYYFEHQLYEVIKKNETNFLYSDFSFPLTFRGISGSTGLLYQTEENATISKKLTIIRGFCELIKPKYGGLRHIWISMISFYARVLKFILRRILSIAHSNDECAL